MSAKLQRGMQIVFHSKILAVILFSTFLFSRCRPERLSPPAPNSEKMSAGVIDASGKFKLNSYSGVGVQLKDMFGINAYEWNFLQDPANPNLKSTIYETNMALIKSFSGVRHYLGWARMESTKGNYTFSPTHEGSWDYDLIYNRCKQEGILVLADIKNCPPWLVSTYPNDMQDLENAPLLYGLSKADPASYIEQARMAFQFAARYGYNANVDRSLVKVDSSVRWTNDPPNQVKVGMSVVSYVECDNERDKWWKGPATQQTAEEYAANMSAFYDGDKGKLGKNAGVKNADPNMKVVMGGLATCNVDFVKKMVEWCRTNRGYRADGSVDLCFDIINYHYYNNNGNILTHQSATIGLPPELSMAGQIADSFVQYANSLTKPLPVWVTESGYDINQGSYQKALYVGDKLPKDTQADWILRTSLLYIRHGIQRVFYYQLFDDTPNVDVQYATSGLAENGKRRPAADFILQTSKLMGSYTYSATLNADPLVDKYVSDSQTMYALTIPDFRARTGTYTLDLGTPKANIYTLKTGADQAVKTQVNTVDGKLTVTVSETPIFVQGTN
ncbi:hypothetical protein [Mucilaginibacter rubeus]|uniref:Glycoside hydrolase family 42 N-terminal domain-containing protein n=1 Tax=Mucilaginibacter rubeus TaxID=2027860 RepID=A0A5C1HYN2_9SPHI|nr:hypothetical protein [Mucilaginibacter rubeus]QEM10260.1 hypothetical protein DEO27_009565 [Mucilaginibacter rubeus]